jgi:hypothetical protein
MFAARIPSLMNTSTLPSPLLGLFGIDDLVILIILGIIIAAALLSIALDMKKVHDDTSRAAAGRAQQKALTDLQTLVDACKENGAASAAQCAEMRRLAEAAASAGVNKLVLAAIKQQIDALCPG